MKLQVDLGDLSWPARSYLRVVAEDAVDSTNRCHSTRMITGRCLRFSDKSAARVIASVRRLLRGRRFVITTLDEASALQGVLDLAVCESWDVAREGRTFAIERELHRFSRSLHLANILDAEDAA